MIPEWSSVQHARPDCPKCRGSGVYNSTPIGTVHWTPCDSCCPHDQGWWLLGEHHSNPGMWCCLAGCGTVRKEKPE